MARLVIGTNKSATTPAIVTNISPTLYRAFEISGGKLIPSRTDKYLMSFDGVEVIDDTSLTNAFFRNTAISGVVYMPNLKRITGYIALSTTFQYCSGITGVDMPLLEVCGSANTTMGSTFSYSGVTTANMPRLTVIANNAAMSSTFMGSEITSFDFYSLKECKTGSVLMGSCFANTNIKRVSFYALTADSFGTRTDQFNGMLSSVTDCVVHFPSNIQSTIGSWASVTGGFGGTNITVLFDLPSTAHLTGADTVEYERNPVYDTSTALAWRVKDTGSGTGIVIDWTPFYTSGTTDPTVGTTIYSDASCTAAVTTVASIA